MMEKGVKVGTEVIDFNIGHVLLPFGHNLALHMSYALAV